jgi:Mycoplasma protein of unknown function, DUF285
MVLLIIVLVVTTSLLATRPGQKSDSRGGSHGLEHGARRKHVFHVRGCSDFDGDLSAWNTSNAMAMDGMFSEASAFNRDL